MEIESRVGVLSSYALCSMAIGTTGVGAYPAWQFSLTVIGYGGAFKPYIGCVVTLRMLGIESSVDWDL